MAGRDKIELFRFIQKTYQAIGISPPRSNQNRNPINSKNFFYLFCHAPVFVSTAGFLLFEANSMIVYGMVFFTCTTLIASIIIYLTIVWQNKNIWNYIENCEQFIENKTNSTILYEETNRQIERFTGFVATIISVSAVFFVLPALLYTIVNYYLLDLGKDSFFLFFPTWSPFDWKSPRGYLLAWLGQCVGVSAATLTAISFFNIIFGSCWLFIVIAKDITSDVTAFNNAVKTLKDRSDRAELTECFCDIIQHYSDAKQCVNDFNEMSKYSMFALLSWKMLAISSLLMTLQFQLWDDDLKLLEIMVLSMSILWVFVNNLAICEIGERVTNQFDEFGVVFGRCEWIKLPLTMQRIYLIFLSDTQQPKHIRSYGGVVCTRETFKQITTKGFSYFMTLRNFRE